MSGITVTRLGDDLIAVKRADPDDPDRLVREASVLAGIAHPGVVQFVELLDDPELELRTRYVGTDTWAHRAPTTDREIIDGLAAVAATVADLHETGTAHGSIRSEHVLVGRDGHPVLCGFADAAPADPTTGADDVDDLASLITVIATAGSPSTRRALEEVAARAADGGVGARDVADALTEVTAAPPRSRRPPRRLTAALAMTAVVAAAIAIWAASRPGPSSAEARSTAEPATASTSTSLTIAGTTPSTTAPPTSTAVPTTAPPTTTAVPPRESPRDAIPDTDPREQNLIEHGGRRYAIGDTDDVVIIGDWTCDGTPTPALLRPADGLVALFAAWPPPDESLEPAAATTITGATDLEVETSDGCDRLRVIRRAGSTIYAPELP